METLVVAAESALGPSPLGVSLCGVPLVALKVDGEVSVFQGLCPHLGTPLASATVEGRTLTCSAHGWQFDAVTGARVGGPGKSLKRFPCTVEGGEVRVSPSDLHAPAAAAQVPPPARATRTLSELPGWDPLESTCRHASLSIL